MRIGKRRCSAASGHTGVSARSARAVSADGGMREHARNWRDRCVTQRAGPAPRAAVRACPRGGPTHLLNSEHIDIRAVREPAAGAIGARQWQCSAWREKRACGVRCRRGAWRVRGAGAGGAWRGRSGRGAARAAVARRQAGGSRRPALDRCTCCSVALEISRTVAHTTTTLPAAHVGGRSRAVFIHLLTVFRFVTVRVLIPA